MSFPRYERYKDSGVEWLGEVPEHWDVAPLKRDYEVVLGKMLQQEAKAENEQLRPYLRAANIQWSGVDITDLKQMWFAPLERHSLLLRKGDLLISEGGDVGRSAIWRDEISDCYFQNSVNRVRSRRGESNIFLCYWMHVLKDKGFIDALCNKSTIAHFTAEKVAVVPTVYPPTDERTAIAAFLDRETGKIDALIAEQRRLIALLKEKRQAVISHAVTKGLNPSAPMKDSGIKWIGEIPSHWLLTRISNYATVQNGTTPSRDKDEYWTDGEIPWLASGEVNQRRISCASEFITKEALAASSLQILPVDTVIVGMVGQGKTRGMSAILGIAACINQNLAGICPKAELLTEYLFYLFCTAYESLREDGRGGQQEALNCQILAAMKIPLPPLKEQQAIARAVSTEEQLFDKLETETESTINLLQERRSALISAAVTGKIDVRKANHAGR